MLVSPRLPRRAEDVGVLASLVGGRVRDSDADSDLDSDLDVDVDSDSREM